jgi:hypothetical protein
MIPNADWKRKNKMRKVYIEAQFKIVIEVEEGIEISEVMDELDWGFVSMTDNADIADVEMLDYEVKDSK